MVPRLQMQMVESPAKQLSFSEFVCKHDLLSISSLILLGQLGFRWCPHGEVPATAYEAGALTCRSSKCSMSVLAMPDACILVLLLDAEFDSHTVKF